MTKRLVVSAKIRMYIFILTLTSFVIGRKNWLFCFAENGAQMSSIAYSMVETAIANKLNVYEYLVYLFDTLPKINNDDVDNLRKLLPSSI